MALNNQEQNEISQIANLLGEQPIMNESELKGLIKELNDDTLDKDGFSAIDMKTRLHPFELSNVIIHDTIVSLNCLPRVCANTTRMKKRLAVSVMGLGRKENIEMVRGERDRTSSSGFGNTMRNLFTPNTPQ